MFTWLFLLSILQLWICCAWGYAGNVLSPPAVKFFDEENNIILENGYVKLTFDKMDEAIVELSADFSGMSDFKTNVLARPFELSTTFTNSTLTKECAMSRKAKGIQYSVVTNSEESVGIIIEGINDCASSPLVSENWYITLHRSERFVQIHIDGRTLASAKGKNVISVGHTIYTKASSVYGLFERGVVQMMNNPGKCLGSDQKVERLYALGEGRSIDVLYRSFPVPDSFFPKFSDAMVNASDLHFTEPSEVVLQSQFGGATDGSNVFYGSAIQDVIIGSYPRKSLDMATAWSELCWEGAVSTKISQDMRWDYVLSLGPNNMDFPVYPVPFTYPSSRALSTNGNLIPNMPDKDIRTFLTGVYASPVGCLQSYFELRDGTIAPTISHPDVGYSPNTNFFDPDNFISVSAMMYSGDAYLMNEVRKIIERTAETMCGIGKEADSSYCDVSESTRLHPRLSSTLAVTHPSNREANRLRNMKPRTGQLMHHFINLEPTYESIATSEQLGPNVFWTLSAIRYASLNNDPKWLEHMLPFFELSARYLASFFDEDQGLLLVPGPLWIDVLVRENYTSDSNAIAPHIFRELAEVFETLNTLPQFADELRRMANIIVESMNNKLWDNDSNDHYITQLDADLKSTRDFVDYDSNLLAVAFDVTPDSRVNDLLARVDSGAYTHVRGTWCCEQPYSGDANDCYIVGGDVCGDSIVTLGRIGWADSHARKRVGDLNTFNTMLLEPLQEDVMQDTWLYERYDANGTQIRTSYYFEYPSLVTMMLTEIRYGIAITLTTVKIDPFPAIDFTFSFGSLIVRYGQDLIQISQQTQSAVSLSKNVSIFGLTEETVYDMKPNPCSPHSESYSTNPIGVLSFTYPIRPECPIILVKRTY